MALSQSTSSVTSETCDKMAQTDLRMNREAIATYSTVLLRTPLYFRLLLPLMIYTALLLGQHAYSAQSSAVWVNLWLS